MALVHARPNWVVYGVNSHSYDSCTIEKYDKKNNAKSLVLQQKGTDIRMVLPLHLYIRRRFSYEMTMTVTALCFTRKPHAMYVQVCLGFDALWIMRRAR